MPRRFQPFLLAVALSLGACGGGSSAPADPAPDPTPDPVPPTESTALVEDMGIYAHAGTDLVEMYVMIRPSDNLEADEDTDCVFVNNMDGVGTTLADVHLDVDGSDACKPEVNVVLGVDGLVDAGGIANAGMRMRGSSSRYAAQKSYRIKLDSKQAADHWRGQRTLQLNKQPYDLTRLRNKLSFDLFIGIPDITSLRTQFVRLWVDQDDGNGPVDFGMYTQLEKVDKYFLASHGLDAEGTVYKAEFFEFERYGQALKLESDPTFNKDAFETILEIEEGSGDHAPLLAMLDAVNDPTSDFSAVMATYFDQDNYLTWLACNILFDNLDTNSQNFFLYRPDASSRFYFLPWDYDGAWDFWGQPKQQVNDGVARWNEGLANWWTARIHQRFFQQPGAVALLDAKLQEIKNTYVTAARVQSLLDTYRVTTDAIVFQMPDLYDLPALDDADSASIMAEYEGEAARLPGLVEAAYQRFLATIERPMPVYMGATPGVSDVEFTWDTSVDLQGDGVTYDFAVSTTPSFDPGTIVTEALGLTGTSHLVPRALLPTGTYFYRVVMRDTQAPGTNWQIAFDTYVDGSDVPFHGVARLVMP